ncbi:MAG: PspA/IM30 family protein [Myxococcota bacterium]
MTRQSRGLFGRIRNLLRGMMSVWLRDTERDNPRAVYEQAINERTHQYRELKEAVAGILFMRNKLEADILERRAEIARLFDDIRRAIRSGNDDTSVHLIAQKQLLMEDLERAERELEGVRMEAEEAKSNLVRFREEIRELVDEKSRMLATLASAQTRRRISEAIDGLSVDADMRALDSVRDHIARISTESSLDREIGADQVRTRIRSIRDEVRGEAARRELAELKQQLEPGLIPEVDVEAAALASSEPVSASA